MRCELPSKTPGFFHERIDRMVRGSQQQHDLTVIRRYFRAYLHCWKTVLHFVRVAKHLEGTKNDRAWAAWCKRWLARLDPAEIEVFRQLRETRDYDTHQGMIEVTAEVADGLFPIVIVVPARPSHSRRRTHFLHRHGTCSGRSSPPRICEGFMTPFRAGDLSATTLFPTAGGGAGTLTARSPAAPETEHRREPTHRCADDFRGTSSSSRAA